jgi:hypothetical protein
MDPFIEEEIMKKHNQAEAFIAIFFAGLDAVCYIIVLVLFGCDFKNFRSPKQRLSLLIALDAILRIINMYSDAYSKYFIKELFLTIFSTIQFSIIVSCINQIITEKGSDNNLDVDLEIRNQKIIAVLFFASTFSFKGIIAYKFISTIQLIFIIVGIYILQKYIGGKIETYLANISKKDTSFIGENFINNMPFFISIYFIIDYIAQLMSLFVEDKLISSYMVMFCKIFKEVGKYLVFLLLITLYHAYNKFIGEEDYAFSNSGKEPEKAKVNIYKDEEEFDEA